MLTWDVTYRGMPLGDAAWRAHLDILRAYLDGRSPPCSDEPAHHEATVAIHADGRILRDVTWGERTPSANEPFRWCVYRLTDYGRLYAAQRLK